MITAKQSLFGIKPDYHLRGSNVALVGNSPAILSSSRGAEIDSHDEVIRFNGATVQGYSASTGSKTTIVCVAIDIAYIYAEPFKIPWMLSPSSIDNDESKVLARQFNAEQLVKTFSDSSFFVFRPNPDQRWTCAADYLPSAADKLQQSSILYYFDQSQTAYMDSAGAANKLLEKIGISTRLQFGGPRTGFKMILRCILTGVTPSLYGFDIDPEISTAEHYYDSVTKEDLSTYKDHDIRSERDAVAELASRGLVKLFGP
jgi:hypothetical protein